MSRTAGSDGGLPIIRAVVAVTRVLAYNTSISMLEQGRNTLFFKMQLKYLFCSVQYTQARIYWWPPTSCTCRIDARLLESIDMNNIIDINIFISNAPPASASEGKVTNRRYK